MAGAASEEAASDRLSQFSEQLRSALSLGRSISSCSGGHCDKCGRPCQHSMSIQPVDEADEKDEEWGPSMTQSLSTIFGAAGSIKGGGATRVSAATCSTCTGTGFTSPRMSRGMWDSDTETGSEVSSPPDSRSRMIRSARPCDLEDLPADDAEAGATGEVDYVSSFFDYLDEVNPMSPSQGAKRRPQPDVATSSESAESGGSLPSLSGLLTAISPLAAAPAPEPSSSGGDGGCLQNRLDKRKERRNLKLRAPALPPVDELEDRTADTSEGPGSHEAHEPRPTHCSQAFQNAVYAAKFAARMKERRGAIMKVRSPGSEAKKGHEDGSSDTHSNASDDRRLSQASTVSEASSSKKPEDEDRHVLRQRRQVADDTTHVSRLQRRMQQKLDRRLQAEEAQSQDAQAASSSGSAPKSSRGFISSFFGYGATDPRPAPGVDEDDDGEGEYHNIWGDSDTEQLAHKRMRDFRRKKLAGAAG